MAWYWWLAASVVGYGCFSLWKAVKRSDADQKALEESVNAEVGRKPDHFYYLRSHDPAPRRYLAAFVAEQKVYIGDYAAPFDRSKFIRPEDIRTWAIEWDTGIDDRGRTYKRRFSLHLAVKSVETPLVKIDCQDEFTAFKMQEIFSQVFGDRSASGLGGTIS